MKHDFAVSFGRHVTGAALMIACAALLLVLSGCGASSLTIHTDVAAFHQLPPASNGATYAVAPSQEQQASLEFRSYEARIRAHLETLGFRPVALESAELVVTIAYSIDSGHEVASSYPIIGQTGVSSSSSTGTVQRFGSTATYSGTTTHTPTYGVVGTGVSSSTAYTRRLRIEIARRDILQGNQIARVYECEAFSSGSSGQLSAVMPSMIESVFQDFPGQSGTVRRVSLESVPTVEDIRVAPEARQRARVTWTHPSEGKP